MERDAQRRLDSIRSHCSDRENNVIDQLLAGKVSRRQFIRSATVFGMSMPVVAVILDACASSSSTTASAGTLHVAEGTEPGTLDPAHISIDPAGYISAHVLEGLFSAYNPDWTVKPLLATGYQVSSDGLTYTLQLRQGVKFHDGTPFNAQAVKINFDRITDPSSPPPLLLLLSLITQTRVVSDYVVQVVISRPLSYFTDVLSSYVAGILSPASLNAGGNTAKNVASPVGTGPYKFKEYVKGDHVSLVRNDAYWGQKGTYQEIEFKIVPDAASREALIRAGQVDVAVLPPPGDVAALGSDPNLTAVVSTGTRTIFMSINCQDKNQPLLRDVRVRQALNYAVDKVAIIKDVLFGLGTQADSPLSAALGGYCSSGAYDYDPQKAKQLLQEAGATGMTLKLGSTTGRYLQDIQAANAIAGYLRAVGVKVEGPTTADTSTYFAIIVVPPAKATLDLHILGFASDYPGLAGGSELMDLLATSQFPPNGYNTDFYSNPKFDALVAQYDTTTDKQQALTAICDAQKLAWNDAPRIYLWTQHFPVVISKKVTGVLALPNEYVYVAYARPA